MNILGALLNLIGVHQQAQQQPSQQQQQSAVQGINRATGFPPQAPASQPQASDQSVVNNINRATGFPGMHPAVQPLLNLLQVQRLQPTADANGQNTINPMNYGNTQLGYENPQERAFGGGGTVGVQGQSQQNLQGSQFTPFR